MDYSTIYVNKDKNKDWEEDCDDNKLMPLWNSPGKCDLAHNTTYFHSKMDFVHKGLLSLFWESKEPVTLPKILSSVFQLFQEREQSSYTYAAELHVLNILCWIKRDHPFLNTIKHMEKKLHNVKEFLADKNFFSQSIKQLMSLPYLAKNKPGKAYRKLQEAQNLVCLLRPCEWTAWYFRSKASLCLQLAWSSSGKARSVYKNDAKKNFDLCHQHFSVLAQEHPSIPYLKFLAIVSLVNKIFLNLKLCWYMFDHTSMKEKFVTFIPTSEHLSIAKKLISQVKKQAADIANDTLWKHDIQYHILELEFFYHCREAQLLINEDDLDKALKSLHISKDNINKLLKEYQNATNRAVLQKFSETVSDLLSDTESSVRIRSVPSQACNNNIISTTTDSGKDSTLSDLDSSSRNEYSQESDVQ